MTESSSRPVRVLQVLAQDDLGGTELMLASMLERIDQGRVQCEVALLSAAGPIAERLRAGDTPVHALGGRGGVRAAWRLARLLRRGGFDVVNGYGLKAGLAVRVAARVATPRPRVVVGVRGLLVTEAETPAAPKARLALGLERATSRLVDLYDSNSRPAADLIVSLGIDPERVRYIPNGIDLARSRDRNGDRALDDAPLIFVAARFTPIKRHADLLRALSLLKRDGEPFRAVLAGSGPTLEPCRALASQLGLSDDVEFPGTIPPEAVVALLSRTDIACLPSMWEGMPGFLMEAMAASVPVVGTAVPGIRELVVDGTTGVLVAPRDPVALKDAITIVLRDAPMAASMGQAGRERIADFSLESMVSAKVGLYEELAGR